MKNFFYIAVLAILFNNIITAQPFVVKGSIKVSQGWNLIGALSTGPVSDILTTNSPSNTIISVWEYPYVQVSNIERGKGYWIKVTEDDVLNFLSPCGGDITINNGDISRIYNTIKIGDQCWLRDNLDVGTMINSTTGGTNNDGEQTNNSVLEKYCYDDDPTKCSNYGGLYQWDEAMMYETNGDQGICPDGWHIPSSADFTTLSANVGGNGNELKEIGEGIVGGKGTNGSGFTVLLAGARLNTGIFGQFAYHTYFWSLTDQSTTATEMFLARNNSSISQQDTDKQYGLSVRCIQDDL